jgi:hypothetical protein
MKRSFWLSASLGTFFYDGAIVLQERGLVRGSIQRWLSAEASGAFFQPLEVQGFTQGLVR